MEDPSGILARKLVTSFSSCLVSKKGFSGTGVLGGVVVKPRVHLKPPCPQVLRVRLLSSCCCHLSGCC